MTASQARDLRRARKRRVLRLLSAAGGRAAGTRTDAELQEIRRALRQWGAITPPFAWSDPADQP